MIRLICFRDVTVAHPSTIVDGWLSSLFEIFIKSCLFWVRYSIRADRPFSRADRPFSMAAPVNSVGMLGYSSLLRYSLGRRSGNRPMTWDGSVIG